MTINTFKDVIDHWPSPSVNTLAADISINSAAVKKWRFRDSIPAEHWDAVVKAAQKRGIEITGDDLIRIAASKVA